MADDRTYIRVHDGLDEHFKIEGLSDGAFRLLVSSWCYCSRNLNDGRITDAAWKRRGTPKTRRELIDAGLAEECDGHVQMHDYLEHQRSAAEVAELKRKRAEAGSKGGKAKASALASAKQVLQQTASKTVPSTEAKADTEQEPSVGGVSHVSSHDGEPPRCIRHNGLPRYEEPPCKACERLRIGWQEQRSADEEFARPSWCGECDEWTRLLETDDGMARCRTCHPLAVAS